MKDSRYNGIRIHWLFLSVILILSLSISFSSACTEDWQCFDWQQCSIENTTSRQCFDISNCGTYDSMPSISKKCLQAFPSCYDNVQNNGETDVDCGGKYCSPCNQGKYCLGDSDCATAYCSGAICSLTSSIPQQPALPILSPYYAYLIWAVVLASLVLIIFLVIHFEHIIPVSSPAYSNTFDMNLSDYLKKRRSESMYEENEGIELESETSEKEVNKIEKRIEKINEKARKQSDKFLLIDNSKVLLPPQKRQKEASPSPSELKKAKILKDIRASYEYSYE